MYHALKKLDRGVQDSMLKTYNEKYVKRGQALVVRDDPQRRMGVRDANRHKVGAPFRYADSLFAALAVIKSIIDLSYNRLTYTGCVLRAYMNWN